MSFFEELKRRNVIRVGIAYVVVAWLTMQFADVVLNNIEAPGWVFQVIMLVLAIGFPLVLVFAWAFEMTPDGLKKEKDVDRSQSIAPQTGKKLNNTILVLMALVIGYLLFDKFSAPTQPGTDHFSQQTSVAQPGTDHFSQQTSGQTTGTNEKSALSPVEAIAQAQAEANPTISRLSIAVLPFANRSDEKEDLFFTDGIHDDLLTQLAKINGLKVISRTSVMEYRDTTKKIKEIAAELGVSKILEGGIQRAGKRIRINAQLIDVATDEHLWAETFDREMTMENIFDIQTEITRQIVTAVRGELTETEEQNLTQLPTQNLQAYEAYLHARNELNNPDYTSEQYLKAEDWLYKAVELDPGFAAAWALLVLTNGQAVWQGYDESPARFEAAQLALANAEKFAPGSPETLAARAEYLYRFKSDFHGAEPLFAAASQARPGDSDLLVRLATTERRTGQFENAVTHYQMAIDLNPADLQARGNLVETLVLMGAYERAQPLADAWAERYPEFGIFRDYRAVLPLLRYGDIKTSRAMLEREPYSTNITYRWAATLIRLTDRDYQGLIDLNQRFGREERLNSNLPKVSLLVDSGRAAHYMGDNEMAEEYTQKAIDFAEAYQSSNPNNMAWMMSALAQAYATSGQMELALAASRNARELKPESQDSLEGPELSNTHAMILAMAGYRDEALAEIERLLNTPAGLNRWILNLSPDWDFFRDDERFNQLIRPPNLEETGQ